MRVFTQSDHSVCYDKTTVEWRLETQSAIEVEPFGKREENRVKGGIIVNIVDMVHRNDAMEEEEEQLP